jgi:hypothetical protein
MPTNKELVEGALLLLKSKDRVAKLTDRELSAAVLSEVWAGLGFGSKADWLLDEMIQRFEKRAGIERDEDGEILPELSTAPWTDTPPADSGEYWHWNGNPDDAPVPITVGYSGFQDGCFVQIGQLGITEPKSCKEYGGWWAPIPEPQPPKI